MQSKSDAQLLREYAKEGLDSAFAELVARHTDLVYSAAWRQTNSPELARDVAQNVFIDLARKAQPVSDKLHADSSLAGWLYRATAFEARNLQRGEFRRQSRERQAMEQFLPSTETSPDWCELRPVLDDAMAGLSDVNREALLLRFFKNFDWRAVGVALGVNEDTAQKRVSRALDTLRSHLARSGVKTSASALSVVLAANAIQAAPAGLALSISTAAALVGSTFATTATATKAIAMTTFQKAMIGATLAAAVGTGIYQARQASDLRARLASLGQQQAPLAEQVQQLQRERDDALRQLAVLPPGRAPRLPAPRMRPGAVAATPEELSSADLIKRILNGENPPKLTAEQTDAFARENHRDAASLLAAFRTSGDPALLEEAMQRFPNDPQVAYEALFKKDASPEQQRHWLDVFKQTAPDNALANYLSAANYFKAGQTDQAVQDLIAASGKPRFQDYTLDRFQGDMEAYRSAGYQEAETSMAATWGLELHQLALMKPLTQSMIDLAGSYRQAGDAASAQTILQMAVNLGTQLEAPNHSGGVPLVTQLVGLAVQGMALSALDPAAPYDAAGLTVKDRQDQIAGQKAAIHDAVKQMSPLQSRMTPQDWITYDNRSMTFGELNAIQWLLNKYGAK